MKKLQIPYKLGPYQILSFLGRGGMGEVLLAYDPICERKVALKRVRSSLLGHEVIRQRFLHEARITAHLSHPGIVSIFGLHEEKDALYYVMPYLEGKTLRQFFTELRKEGKEGVDRCMTSLLNLFVQICQTVAYAHSKGFLHRDLKPDNIMLGTYGQVFIFDWGLVEAFEEELPLMEVVGPPQWTNPQKPVGTVAYMAPERVLGAPATVQSDLYSLGVILYQLLTLKLPFHRASINHFRQTLSEEVVPNPMEVAPYREITPELVAMVKGCLAFKVHDRYTTVDALLQDLENYLHGRITWHPWQMLSLAERGDWRCQEAVLLPQGVAIARRWQRTQWAIVMLSAAAFSGNTRIRFRCKIKEHGEGFGVLLGVPQADHAFWFSEGYCLWLSPERGGECTHLLRSASKVVERPDIVLKRDVWHEVAFDRVESQIQLFIDGVFRMTYNAHLPIQGGHVGVLYRDEEFEVEGLEILMGSLPSMITCLAVADALFAHRLFDLALFEYRRIALSFAGRIQGRQALFRIGVVLTEQTLQSPLEERQEWIERTSEAFEQLRHTPDAPLEYLGKAFFYERLDNAEEECKCFALALRRYPEHPRLHLLEEQMISRLQIHALRDRLSACRLALLLVQCGPESIWRAHQTLFALFANHLEPIPFIIPLGEPLSDIERWGELAIQLSFWLAQPYTLVDLAGRLRSCPKLIDQIILALHLLDADQMADSLRETIGGELQSLAWQRYALNRRLEEGEVEPLLALQPFYDPQSDLFLLWAALLEGKLAHAGELLSLYPLEELRRETHPLYFVYGCYLFAIEGQKAGQAHFASILDTTYPRSWTIGAHALFDRSFEEKRWLGQAFFWEKKLLTRQLVLFTRCQKEPCNTPLSDLNS